MQQRNSSTILLIEDMLAYRKEILQSIISFPEIFVSDEFVIGSEFNSCLSDAEYFYYEGFSANVPRSASDEGKYNSR